MPQWPAMVRVYRPITRVARNGKLHRKAVNVKRRPHAVGIATFSVMMTTLILALRAKYLTEEKVSTTRAGQPHRPLLVDRRAENRQCLAHVTKHGFLAHL